MKKNIILIDFKKKNNWTFEKVLNEDENWETICKVSNFKTKNIFSKLFQYLIYFMFPIKIFISRKKYNKIIAWQQFYGLIFAYYCSAFKVKKTNKLIIMTFIFKKKKGIIGKIYYKWIKKIIYSNYVDKLIVFSTNEIDYYSKIFPECKEKFIYMNLGVEIQYEIPNLQVKNYFVSAGKSNRDYKFLIKSFKKINERLYIISYTSPPSQSDNVKILNDCFGVDYYKYIAESFAVIISLDDENISSGQLVLIHAMQQKKPIICTKSNAITNYVIDGYNGFIIDKDFKQLEEAIKKLKNKKIYKKLSENSYTQYINEFSIEKMANNIKKILK